MPLNIPLPPNSGTTYGDVQFDASAETTDFSLKQVYSEDQRYIVHTELAITIRAYVTLGMDDPQVTVDSQMTHLRETLETNGLPFTYKNGAGTISVNTGAPGGQQDIDFGPKPTLLRFKPTGSGTSAKIFWSVVIRIPECPVSAVYAGIKEFNFKVSWNINKGLTRRSINGFFVIANNFNPGTRVTRDSADKYRETLTASFPVPVNYHRMAPQNYTLSGNRSREEFTIVDEQLPNQNTPPPGTLLPQFTHRVTIDKLYGVMWNGSFNATYPVPLGAPQERTFYYFWRAVLQRLRATYANQANLVFANNPATGKTPKRLVILRGFSMEESDAYGQTVARYTLSYSFLATLKAIVGVAQLWTPLPDSDWTMWKASLNTVWGVRGLSGQGFNNVAGSSEVVISLCQPSAPSGASLSPGVKVSVSPFNADKNNPFPANMTTNPFGYPTADGSWLRFVNFIRIQPQDSTIELKPLPPTEIDPNDLDGTNTTLLQQQQQQQQNLLQQQPFLGIVATPGFAPTTQQPSASVAPLPASPGQQPALAMRALPTDGYDNVKGLPAPDVEVRCAPSVYVYLIGMGIRAGYGVDPPSLVSVGGIKAVTSNDETCFVDQGTPAIWGGIPIQICHGGCAGS